MKLSPPTRPSEPVTATGVVLQQGGGRLPRAARETERRRRPIGGRGWFLLLVVLPTLLSAAYYYVYAADIYESEARFIVRTSSGGGGGMGGGADGGFGVRGLGNLLTQAKPGGEEALAVGSYLDSHAAVLALRPHIDVVELWRRPEADPIARLWWENPELEWLTWYFRRRVRVTFDSMTQVIHLRVHAFRPDDANQLAEKLLVLSEDLVNTFNERSSRDALRLAEEEVAKAERRLLAAREALIAFREREQSFDPAGTATGAVTTIASLQAALTQARADLQERRSFMRPDNPQIQMLQNRIAALQTQIAAERTRVTRGDEALTQQVAGFERLELERMLADRQYASAVSFLDSTRTDALRQKVYLVRVAEPHMPEYALYPRAAFNTLTIFISLSVMFGIGWLLVVSAREHAS